MRIARISTSHGPRHATTSASGDWALLDGSIADGFTPTHEVVAASGAVLLAPCEPRVVLGMAHNALPKGRALPPQAFLKSARTVVGPDTPIVLDADLGDTNVEAELAIVIGRTARHLTRENALDAVFGFTIGNDVTAVTQNPLDELLTQSKNGDGFTPVGPWIETELPGHDDLGMRVIVDGVHVASGATSGLANLVIDQLVYLTRYTTLGPGDIVLGGCPGSLAPVRPGQHVRLEIDGIGSLDSPVHALGALSKEEPHAVQR
jgi:2-keto-4-pentenoate hydratase/2-oxohepta-3-ene-1,7-dioic acid hydratase in catechol pathway